MTLDKIHLIEGKDMRLAYCYPSADIRIISKETYGVLSALKEKRNIQDLSVTQAEQDRALAMLDSMESGIAEETNGTACLPNSRDRRVMQRITLHVSNDCNLRCKYCYANGGDYGMERHLMSEQTAAAFVDFCVTQFEMVKKIVFFGGEPMLNLAAMEAVCNRFAYYKDKGTISYLPVFVIITNGTVLTDRILSFVKKNISAITVSIDGPKEVNDLQRVYRNGKGCYEEIARFIRTIKEETDAKIIYEATYTQRHISLGYTHEDVGRFMEETFGIQGVIVNEHALGFRSLLDFWEMVDLEYLRRTRLRYLPQDFWILLRAVAHNTKVRVCPVVDRYLAVGYDGSLYACHTINGLEKQKLGNIVGENIYNHPQRYKPFDKKLDFRANEQCRNCWAQRLCGGCPVHRFFNRQKNIFELYPDSNNCEVTRACIEKILLIIASVRKDSELWALAVEMMNTAGG